MVENRKKHRQNSHPIIHCPTSEGVSEVSERVSAAEGASEASSPEQANGRASGPVLDSCLFQTTVQTLPDYPRDLLRSRHLWKGGC